MKKRLNFLLLLIIFLPLMAVSQTPGTITQIKKISALQGNIPTGVLTVGAHFGCSIDTIGDLNNDGIVDLIVGAYADDDGGNGRGAAYVLFMDTNRSVKSYQKISSTQGSFTSNGLANGDGFGYRVAGIGDINNDGIPDIGVGANFCDAGGANTGRLYIIFLDTNGTVKSHQKIDKLNGYNISGLPLTIGGSFGSISCVGDINNDGIPDIAVGAPLDSGGSSNSSEKGAIWILKLNSLGKVSSYYKIQNGVTNFTNSISNGNRLGVSVTNIGDINNDGYPDIAAGAFRDNDGGYNNGAVYVILLNSTGSVKSYNKISASNFSSGAIYGEFGVSVSGVPDMDGNGVVDLLVGAYSQDSYTGGAYLVNIDTLGNPINQIHYAGSSFGNNGNNDRLGWGTSRWTNTNHNAYIEVCLGAARDDDGGTSTGAVYIASIKPYLSAALNSTQPLCNGDSTGMIIASGSGSNPPFTYLWNTGSTNDTLFNVCAGTYTVTTTNSLGVTASTSIYLNQPSQINISSSSNTSICMGDSITLSAFGTGGTGNKNFHWNQGLPISNSNIVSPSTNTNYKVWATDNHNCLSDTNNIQIIVNSLPTTNFIGLNSAYCSNNGIITLTGSPSGGVFSGIGIVGNTFNPNIASIGINQIVYSYTDGNSCTGRDTNTTNIVAAPTIQFSGINSAYCTNDASFTLSTKASPTGGNFWINNVANAIFNPSTLGTGNYWIRYAITNSYGCSDIDSTQCFINSAPITDINGLNPTYCKYDTIINLIGSPSGGNFSGNGISGTLFNPSNLSTGNDSIIYSFTNMYGCSDTSIAITSILSTPIANAGQDQLVPCSSNGLTIGETPETNHTYLWSPYAGLNNPFIANPVANPWVDSTIFVVTKTNLTTQCQNKDSVLITLAQDPQISISGDTIICSGDSVHLSASGANTYQWKHGIIGGSFDYPLFITQYISVIGTDSNNCSNQDSVVVIANPIPQPYLGNDTSIFMDSIILYPGVFASYQWNTGDITSSITIHSSLTPGSYNYSVHVVDQNGCIGSDTIVINITTGLGSKDDDIYIKAYPNPSRGLVNLEWSSDIKIRSYEVYDSFGRFIHSIAIKPNSVQTQVNLKGLAKGNYFIRLKGDKFDKIVNVVVE